MAANGTAIERKTVAAIPMSDRSPRAATNAKSIIIPASVSWLDQEALGDVQTVEVIAFAPRSRLSALPDQGLCACKSLKSICFPASLKSLPSFLFSNRPGHSTQGVTLKSVTFERGSKLRTIDDSVFHRCYSLKSICLPASVESMNGSSLADCGLEA
jgi:hypothetical protein